MAIEEPKYDIVLTEGDYEIRHYYPMIIAEAEVDGDMDLASNKGFRLIADFIFGNNLDPETAETSKIEMTAPVTVQPASAKIDMTAPVTGTPQTVDQDMSTAQKWKINFVMPSQFTLTSIPRPKNEAVKLKEVPSKYFVVYKYSGFNTSSRVQDESAKTLQWVNDRSLTVIGAPKLSRYDPPWTLPMFRRNEIMIEISRP